MTDRDPGLASILVFAPIILIELVWPSRGWAGLLLLIPVWGIAFFRRRTPIRRTPLDMAVVVFILMALIGVWTAYEVHAAIVRFVWILTAVFFYYAVACQPMARLRLILGFIVLAAAAVAAGYFVVTYWPQAPGIRSAIESLNPVRPSVILTGDALLLLPNAVGGTLAALFPLAAVDVLLGWKPDRGGIPFLSIAMAGLILAALIATSSRGAWLALAAAGLSVVGGRLSVRPNANDKWRWLPVVLFGLALLGWGATLRSASLAAWFDGLLPGLPAAASRAELAQASLRLIGDVPFSGAGLGAFAGWYSHYIRIIPQFYFANAHNLYLDIAFEQGILGLVALLVFMVGGLWVGAKRTEPAGSADERWIHAAALVGLLTIMFHGLVDDPIYPHGGVLVPFLLVGLLGISEGPSDRSFAQESAPRPLQLPNRLAAAWAPWVLLTVALVLTGFSPWSRSKWLSNLGAVQLARSEISEFPSNTPLDGLTYESDAGNVRWFERSLQVDDHNRTALQRLGEIEARSGEYERAASRLWAAYALDPGHLGVRKLLGLTLAWNGRIDQAAALLRPLQDAPYELDLYGRYWSERGRPLLAQYAVRTAAALRESSSNLE